MIFSGVIVTKRNIRIEINPSLSYPELFIKNVDVYLISAKPGPYPDIAKKTFQEVSFYIYQRFLPFGRVDLNASTSPREYSRQF